jgi:ribosomal protein S27AE
MGMTRGSVLELVCGNQHFIAEHMEPLARRRDATCSAEGGVVIANHESVMMLNGHRTAPCLVAHVEAIDQAAASRLLGDTSTVVRANPPSLATNWTRLA